MVYGEKMLPLVEEATELLPRVPQLSAMKVNTVIPLHA
jgi:hypothetical protein